MTHLTTTPESLAALLADLEKSGRHEVWVRYPKQPRRDPTHDHRGRFWHWEGGEELLRSGYGADYVHTCEYGLMRALERVPPLGPPGTRVGVREEWVRGWVSDGGTLHTVDDNGNDIPERIWYRADRDLDEWWIDDEPCDVPWEPAGEMKDDDIRLYLRVVSNGTPEVRDGEWGTWVSLEEVKG